MDVMDIFCKTAFKKQFSQMREPLKASLEPAGDQNRPPSVLYIF